MARIAVVSGPDPGHALPTLGVAAELVRRSHDVTFWSGRGHGELARHHGCRFAELPALTPTGRDHDLGYLLWERGAAMAALLAERLRQAGVDLVVSDVLTRAGAFAAQVCEVPWVEVIPHHLPDPAPDLPPVGLGRGPARHVLRRLDDRRLSARQEASVAAGHRQALQAARGLGLTHLVAPAIRLVATLPALERPRQTWPARAHVVGPLAAEPLLPRLRPPEGDDPLVVVTDSTATGARGGLGAAAVSALQHLDLRLVVTSSALRPRRDGRVVVGRGPHGPLLADAALAIGPGGGGFVAKAATAGVPMVVVPGHGDQREAAARLRELGVARVVGPGRLTPPRLRWAAVRQLLDDRASTAADVLARQAGHLGPRLAGDLVEEVLAGRRPFAEGPGEHLPR